MLIIFATSQSHCLFYTVGTYCCELYIFCSTSWGFVRPFKLRAHYLLCAGHAVTTLEHRRTSEPGKRDGYSVRHGVFGQHATCLLWSYCLESLVATAGRHLGESTVELRPTSHNHFAYSTGPVNQGCHLGWTSCPKRPPAHSFQHVYRETHLG